LSQAHILLNLSLKRSVRPLEASDDPVLVDDGVLEGGNRDLILSYSFIEFLEGHLNIVPALGVFGGARFC
jgi:hypothetical protein